MCSAEPNTARVSANGHRGAAARAARVCNSNSNNNNNNNNFRKRPRRRSGESGRVWPLFSAARAHPAARTRREHSAEKLYYIFIIFIIKFGAVVTARTRREYLAENLPRPPQLGRRSGVRPAGPTLGRDKVAKFDHLRSNFV